MRWDDMSKRVRLLLREDCVAIRWAVDNAMTYRADGRCYTRIEVEHLLYHAEIRREARMPGAAELCVQLELYLKYALQLNP